MVCVLSAAHTIALIFGNSYDFFLSCTRFYLINKILFCDFGRILHSQIVPDDGFQEEKEVLFLSFVCNVTLLTVAFLAFDHPLFGLLHHLILTVVFFCFSLLFPQGFRRGDRQAQGDT